MRPPSERNSIEAGTGMTTAFDQCGHFFISLDAAREGRGIALVPDIIVAHDEAMRGLVVPFTSNMESAGEYYLLIHESSLDTQGTGIPLVGAG